MKSTWKTQAKSFPGRTLEPDSGQKFSKFRIPAQTGGGDVLMQGWVRTQNQAALASSTPMAED